MSWTKTSRLAHFPLASNSSIFQVISGLDTAQVKREIQTHRLTNYESRLLGRAIAMHLTHKRTHLHRVLVLTVEAVSLKEREQKNTEQKKMKRPYIYAFSPSLFLMCRNCLTKCDWCQQFWNNAALRCNTDEPPSDMPRKQWRKKRETRSYRRTCRAVAQASEVRGLLLSFV